MPQISQKGKSMPASPIRKLVPYADIAKAKGRTVYHLNIGQPDILSPQAALDAIHNFPNKIIEYGHSAGNLSYRKGLEKYYNDLGMNITYNDILVTTGGSEALILSLTVCLNSGDEVIIPEPFYTNYNAFVEQAGVKIVPVPTSIETGFALPPISEFERRITPRTRAILLCNPNNPTGYIYSKEELESLREIVLRHDLFLICDEVYRVFCYTGEKYHSCMDLEGLEDNVIIVDSTSKRYSMCGIRVGAIITRNKEVSAAMLHFCQSRLCAPAIGQVAAEAALSASDTYFEEIRREYMSRRDCLIEGMNSIDGVLCPSPAGAFYTIARLPVDNAETFAAWMLSEFEYKRQTVMVAPAAGFYKTENMGVDEVRIAYVLKKEHLRNAVECIKHAIDEYNSISG